VLGTLLRRVGKIQPLLRFDFTFLGRLEVDTNFTARACRQRIGAIVTGDVEGRVGSDIGDRNRGRTGIVGYRFNLR
jgi:hypothetical protein